MNFGPRTKIPGYTPEEGKRKLKLVVWKGEDVTPHAKN